MALEKIVQDDFSAGIFRSTARHLIDPRGVYDATSVLLDDDGSLYRRGGTTYKSSSAFGSGLRWITDLQLPVGLRTLFASPTAFGVLDSDDTTVINLGGSGLSAPTAAAIVGGMVFIGGGTIYGGTRKTAGYSTGTVSVTNNSPTVTGAGTSWTANVDAGMLFRVGASGPYYVVKSVDSNTQITLYDSYAGSTAAGQAYSLSVLGSTAAGGYRTGNIYASIFDRLVECESNRIYFSASRNTTTGGTQPHSFAATDYHELPGGSQILGAFGLRGVLLVFATSGLWAVSNMAYSLTDQYGNSQQRLERLDESLILWDKAGVAVWNNALIVPCVDGVWLVDGVSSPQFLSRSIWPVYTGYVRAGYRLGVGCVYRNSYLLPVLDGSNAFVDLLVCRLDRPIDTRIGTVFPWTRLAGYSAQSAGMVQRIGTATRSPYLLSANLNGRVVDCSGWFEPSGALKNDADGSTHSWVVTLRDFPTGQAPSLNTVRRLRARYELVDAGSDDPTISASYSTGQQQSGLLTWGSFTWGAGTWTSGTDTDFVQLPDNAPEDDGRNPFSWLLEPAARARYLRVRLQSAAAAASMKLRSVELYVRLQGRDR